MVRLHSFIFTFLITIISIIILILLEGILKYLKGESP